LPRGGGRSGRELNKTETNYIKLAPVGEKREGGECISIVEERIKKNRGRLVHFGKGKNTNQPGSKKGRKMYTP